MIWYGGRERSPTEMAQIVVAEVVETARNNMSQFFSVVVDLDTGKEFPEPIESEMEEIKKEMDKIVDGI